MLGERDVSILGRLKDKVNNSSFNQFRLYMNNKLEYIEDKIEPAKNALSSTRESLER